MRLAKWCWTVLPGDGIFNSHRKTIMDLFSCMLFLPQFNLRLNMHYFMLKYTYLNLQSRTDWFGSSQWRWCQKVWQKMMSKLMSERQKDILMSCMSHGVRRNFLAPVGYTDNAVGYARKNINTPNFESWEVQLHFRFLCRCYFLQN